MELTFWGVRGSFPVAKPHVRGFGGNTACVHLKKDDFHLIIDAGTGIRGLGTHLMKEQGVKGPVHLLISHTHWDHIQGFPFFAPAYSEDFALTVHSVFRPSHSLKELLTKQQDQNFFPVPLSELRAEIHFELVTQFQRHQMGPFAVSCRRLNHPGVSAGFRIECEDATIAYVSDLAPADELLLAEALGEGSEAQKLAQLHQNQLDLAADADVVIYDTMFTQEEYSERKHWGHSTPEHGIEACLQSGAKHLFLFHHNPDTDDEALAARVDAHQQAHPELKIRAAREQVPFLVEDGRCEPCK